ncbi:MAG: RNB domain-containing ribonuclease [Methanoregula sp.]|nr:RNB domain-containing ribonuclease [Methanoregula sp.]
MKPHHTVDLRSIAWHAMEKYGFTPLFPQPVIEEVNALHEKTFSEDQHDARDLRSLLWSSIDNHDSMDLDQIEYCEREENGKIHVMVAIADVDVYIKKQSETDLLPGQDRIAVVIEYMILPGGSFQPGEVYRALVCNKAKLVYEEVGAWLEGTGPIPKKLQEVPGLEEQLHLQNEASQILRKNRREQGALELDTIEAEAVVEGDTVRDLIVKRQNLARCVIEEFMVAANGTMVACLGNAGVPMIQRIVRTPRNWGGIVLTAATHGEILPDTPDAKALAKFLIRQKETDPERFPDLSLTIVKLLGPGEYMMLEPGAPPTGHFALAVIDYTHATAPNRRYVDVINQRLVKSILDKRPSPYPKEELSLQSAYLTGREKAAKKVQRFMRKAAAAVLLRHRLGESFDALVTGTSEKGTYVRLITPPAEGRVIRGEKGLRVGQKVRVRLLKTDPFNGFIDFERAGGR